MAKSALKAVAAVALLVSTVLNILHSARTPQEPGSPVQQVLNAVSNLISGTPPQTTAITQEIVKYDACGKPYTVTCTGTRAARVPVQEPVPGIIGHEPAAPARQRVPR